MTTNNSNPHTTRSNNTNMQQTITTTTTSTAKQFAEEHWNKAAQVLSERPSLMTRHVLILVLKNRPPYHVVEYMLSLNPQAADIPPQGPSPLQVAVRHYASVEVIRLVIQACPLALVATHSGYDPLMYAKIWRREEPELLALLAKPLSYWVEHNKATSSVLLENNATPTTTTTTSTTRTIQAPQYSTTTSSEEELNNIKRIAATILRAQKNQVTTLQQHRQYVDAQFQSLQQDQHQERLAQLEELKRLQQFHFKSQLIALDMKERRMLARVQRMEQRIHKTMELSHATRQVKERRQDFNLQRMETKVESVRGNLHAVEARMNTRLEIAELRLEQESRVNDYFRGDVRLQLDQLEFRSSVLQGWSAPKEEEEWTPVVYATPFVVDDQDEEERLEMDAVVPLWPQEENASCFRAETKNDGTKKRSYPTRKKKRHFLGMLSF